MEIHRTSSHIGKSSDSQENQTTQKSQTKSGSTNTQNQGTSSDTIETAKAPSMLEYLHAVGADSVLTENEINAGIKNPTVLKGLMDVVSAGQTTGSSGDAIDEAKSRYLKDPSATGLNDAVFHLVAKTQGVPEEEAKRAGITSASKLLNLQANLTLLGDDNAATHVASPQLYEQIKKNGLDNILANTFIQNANLPVEAKGLKLKSLLNATAAAQDLGLDSNKADFWKHVRKDGVQGLYRDELIKKRHLPDDAKKLSFKEVQQAIKNAKGDSQKLKDPKYWKDILKNKEQAPEHEHNDHKPGGGKTPVKTPHGEFIAPIISGDHRYVSHHPHKPKVNPLASGPQQAQSHSTQHHEAQRHKASGQSKQPGGQQHDPFHPHEPSEAHAKPKQEAEAGDQPTPGDPNAPAGGTNPNAGAANDHSQGAGDPNQTGIGVSAADGTAASSGAVNTFTGVHHGLDGSVSYNWDRSGSTDGTDGHYTTTYYPQEDGTYWFTVVNNDTGDQVNQGYDDPPNIKPSTSQTTVGDKNYFEPADDDDTSDDDDSGGKPLPTEIYTPRGTVVSVADLLPRRGDGVTDSNPAFEQREDVVFGDVLFKKGDGFTDGSPLDDLTRNAFSSQHIRRGQGFTDPSREGSGGKQPASTDHPSGPSHSRDTGHRSAQRLRRRSH